MTVEQRNYKVEDSPSAPWNGEITLGARSLFGILAVIGGALVAGIAGYGELQNQLGALEGRLEYYNTDTVDAAIQEGLEKIDAKEAELKELFDGPLIDDYMTHIHTSPHFPDRSSAFEYTANLMTAKQGFCFLAGVTITHGHQSGSISIYDTLIDTDGTHNWFLIQRSGHPDSSRLSITDEVVNTPLREQEAVSGQTRPFWTFAAY